ncbi:MAG: TPM domain-containing protein [Rhizomicrobium sp.]
MSSTVTKYAGRFLALGLVLFGLTACGINDVPTQDEQVKAAWSEVQNQYQRRADLIPNLVATVKGYAKQEETVLREVTEARAHATQMTIPSDILTNPQKFHEFEQNQAAISGALGRLLAVSENLSRPEIEPELPGAAGAARGDGEPHHRGAQGLYRRRAALQHDAAHRALALGGRDLLSRRQAARGVHHLGQEPVHAHRAVLIMRLGSAVRVFAVALAALAFLGVAARAALDFPPLTGRVVDEAGVLSAGTKEKLTALLAEHERQTGNQVVVATLKSLRGTSIEDYGYQLGRAWGIGQKGRNNGALILVSPSTHDVRIEVGYGLEGTLTDAQSVLIIHNVMMPAFRKGDYDAGVLNGTLVTLQALGGKPSTSPPEDFQSLQRDASDGGNSGFHIPIIVIIIVLWLVFGRFFWPLFFLGGLGGGGRGGGWGGGGGWSGGSGGGFSGGGGSFGGGGASGHW